MKPTSVIVPARKPRNPLVPAAQLRRAGAHGRCGGGERQQARRTLRRELAAIAAYSP